MLIKSDTIKYREFPKVRIKIHEQVKELEAENEELQRENERLKDENEIMNQALRYLKNILSDIETD